MARMARVIVAKYLHHVTPAGQPLAEDLLWAMATMPLAPDKPGRKPKSSGK